MSVDTESLSKDEEPAYSTRICPLCEPAAQSTWIKHGFAMRVPGVRYLGCAAKVGAIEICLDEENARCCHNLGSMVGF